MLLYLRLKKLPIMLKRKVKLLLPMIMIHLLLHESIQSVVNINHLIHQTILDLSEFEKNLQGGVDQTQIREDIATIRITDQDLSTETK